MASRISVALCTCDGERYLPEQLASLERQSRPPDELVVSDDGSNDGTPEIVAAFRDRAPFPVHLSVNPARLGPAGNFGRAISLCTGDLIALCDQDDVWLPEKLARGERALDEAPGAAVAFADAAVVDEELRPLGYGLWDALGFTPAEQARMREGEALPVLLRHQVVTGMTMMFRASLRPLVLPIPPSWIQDGWIALLVAATGSLVLVAERLVLYRQHAGNRIGAARMGWLDLLRHARRPGAGAGLATDLARFRAARERLGIAVGASVRQGAAAHLDDMIAHLEVRSGLARPRFKRLVPVLREASTGRYGRYSRGLLSVGQDLFW